MHQQHQPQNLNDLDYKARRALVLGVNGTGKSTLMSRFVSTHPADLVLIYDWQGGEFARRLGAFLVTERDGLIPAVDAGHRIICYDAEAAEGDPQGEGFAWFCAQAFAIGGALPGRKLIVIDECQDLIDPWNIPPELKEILAKGRRRRMDTLIAGAAPNALQTTARDQVSELYIFRLVDENSLKYPRSLGMDDKKIRELPDTYFIYKDMRTGDEKELDLWGQKRQATNNP